MLSPKKVKYRKQQKGKMRGAAHRGCNLDFGEFGLQAVECGTISSKQIEAARIAMTRHVKRGGKMWIRIFPDKPFTKKPAEVRMGKGKDLRRDGLQSFVLEEYFMRWRGFPENWQRKHFGLPHISFL